MKARSVLVGLIVMAILGASVLGCNDHKKPTGNTVSANQPGPQNQSPAPNPSPSIPVPLPTPTPGPSPIPNPSPTPGPSPVPSPTPGPSPVPSPTPNPIGTPKGADPSDNRIPTTAVRKSAYQQSSVKVDANTAFIWWLAAIHVSGGGSGEVLVDEVKVYTTNASGVETLLTTDSYPPGTNPWGGAFSRDPWFGAQTHGQNVFSVNSSGHLVCPVSLYPDDVLHPWGMQWPRAVIPADAVSIRVEARVRAVGDAGWQAGGDFYSSSTAPPPPSPEAGASDWFFEEHGWVDVTVGPIPLTR